MADRPLAFTKDLTVSVELVGGKEVTALELMKGIRLGCGGLLACRPTGQKTFEVTMSDARGKAKLLEGFMFGETVVLADP